MPPTTVFVIVALFITGGLVALVFVGPIFAIAILVIAGLLFWIGASLAARADSGLSSAERPRAVRRIAWVLFLLTVIASVAMQAHLLWDHEACIVYDWLDGTVDGRCDPLIHGIAGTDDGLSAPTHDAPIAAPGTLQGRGQ